MPQIYDKRLDNLGFPTQCPVRAIVRAPHNILQEPEPATAGDRARFLEMATKNIFEYGRRKRWSWLAMPNPANCVQYSLDFVRSRQILLPDGLPHADARLAVTKVALPGWGLLAGQSTWDNCGGFNSSLLFLSRHVFGFQGVIKAAISGYFVTTRVPGGVIDPCFKPTVRTYTRDYDETGLYFFMGHEFVRYADRYYDVTTGNVFQQNDTFTVEGQTSDEKYCDLSLIRNPVIKARYQNAEIYEVSNENVITDGELGLPHTLPKRLLRVIPNKYNHWSGFLLTRAPCLSAQDLAGFSSPAGQIRQEPNAIPDGQSTFFSTFRGRRLIPA